MEDSNKVGHIPSRPRLVSGGGVPWLRKSQTNMTLNFSFLELSRTLKSTILTLSARSFDPQDNHRQTTPKNPPKLLLTPKPGPNVSSATAIQDKLKLLTTMGRMKLKTASRKSIPRSAIARATGLSSLYQPCHWHNHLPQELLLAVQAHSLQDLVDPAHALVRLNSWRVV
jgi:hypothetical protein